MSAGGGTRGERQGGNPSMNEREKSDRPVLPAKLPNKPGERPRRWWREGACARGTRPAKRAPDTEPGKARQVRLVACAESQSRTRSTVHRALHHVDVDRLRAAYWALNPKAATGVDGVTWQEYGQDLEENLRDLHARVHRGAIGRSRRAGRTYRSQMGGCGRSGSARWRTRSSSGRWSRC